jgi:dsRNA-specific ribonuclease
VGRLRRNNLCDGFEALLGALYLDQGLDAVRDFVLPLLLPRVEYILAEGLHKRRPQHAPGMEPGAFSTTHAGYRVVIALARITTR